MNTVELTQEIVACRMTELQPAIESAVYTEAINSMTDLLRTQMEIAVGEAMTAVLNEIIQDESNELSNV